MRIQSHAQVVFSDPILIRYGSGVEQNDDHESDDASDDDQQEDNGKQKKRKAKKISCPVLEFRIVNRLFDEVGGEIMDARLNVVANVDANDADPVNTDGPGGGGGADASGSRGLRRRGSGTGSVSTGSTSMTEVNSVGNSRRPFLFSGRMSRSNSHSKFEDFLQISRHGRGKEPIFSSDSKSQQMVSKHIFSKMYIEASEHPFFKRVWLARHVLDDSSPILSPRTRRAIQKNGGFWPEHLNSWEGIRQSLKFNQILVSLNGVSNVSASDVYAQKIYDLDDVNIGYQFVNLLYRGEGDHLMVDVDLINDVREQNGGGGEPFTES